MPPAGAGKVDTAAFSRAPAPDRVNPRRSAQVVRRAYALGSARPAKTARDVEGKPVGPRGADRGGRCEGRGRSTEIDPHLHEVVAGGVEEDRVAAEIGVQQHGAAGVRQYRTDRVAGTAQL